MPAILPARLKIQSLELASLYLETDLFIRNLYDLLERYADHSYRSGVVRVPKSLVPSLHVPTQVIKQISSAVIEAADDQEAIIRLCNELWKEPNLECRIVAAKILSQARIISEKTIIDTIHQWQPYLVDEELQREIYSECMNPIIKHDPSMVLKLADSWFEQNELRKSKSGLLLLECMVTNSNFVNSPVIYRRISPLLRESPLDLRPTLLILLHHLARRFPQETTYIFSESLKAKDNPDTIMLIRQILDQLPAGSQDNLRNLIQETKRKT